MKWQHKLYKLFPYYSFLKTPFHPQIYSKKATMAMSALRREGRRLSSIISPNPINTLRSPLRSSEYDLYSLADLFFLFVFWIAIS